jgi:hypothetical protein
MKTGMYFFFINETAFKIRQKLEKTKPMTLKCRNLIISFLIEISD